MTKPFEAEEVIRAVGIRLEDVRRSVDISIKKQFGNYTEALEASLGRVIADTRRQADLQLELYQAKSDTLLERLSARIGDPEGIEAAIRTAFTNERAATTELLNAERNLTTIRFAEMERRLAAMEKRQDAPRDVPRDAKASPSVGEWANPDRTRPSELLGLGAASTSRGKRK